MSLCRRMVLFGALALISAPSAAAAQTRFDVVLEGGRVIDPESGLDAIRNVGIQEGRVAAISVDPLEGEEVVDVSGLVVAPGFVDLHAHGQDLVSSQLQAQDGVTTALELEGGAAAIDAWYRQREGDAVIHYGATVSHGAVRRAVLGSPEAGLREAATVEQIEAIRTYMARGLDAGALGFGFGLAYTPGATREEVHRLFELSAERGITNFVHVRYAGLIEPGSSAEAFHEMIGGAAATGASVHIVHIGSSGLQQVPLMLEMIAGAQARGLDVTTEVYPYTAASTRIQAAIFDPGWRARLGVDYEAIEWVATGERLDSISFAQRREEGGIIIAHVIPETSVEAALAHPIVMVASDGVPFINGRAHPRGAGSFARVLGRYVREREVLTLMDAIRKMTLMPAQRLEEMVPAMSRKGRVSVGADADLTVFDATRVIDRATFKDPDQPSEGIEFVMVNGTWVVKHGSLVPEARPGQPIRRTQGRPMGGA